MDTACPEDFMVVVEAFECGVELIERTFSEDVPAGDITEVEEGIETFGETGWHKTFE